VVNVVVVRSEHQSGIPTVGLVAVRVPEEKLSQNPPKISSIIVIVANNISESIWGDAKGAKKYTSWDFVSCQALENEGGLLTCFWR
jgi:hypothetical protein